MAPAFPPPRGSGREHLTLCPAEYAPVPRAVKGWGEGIPRAGCYVAAAAGQAGAAPCPTSLNNPDAYILAIVEFLPDGASDGRHRVHYVRRPFQREPDFAAASVNYAFADLLARAQPPSEP